MKLLKDDQLKDLYDGPNPVITGVPAPKNWTEAGSPVQPSSIDLQIGKICLPAERSSQKPDEITRGRHKLLPGQTAIVTTLEHLNMRPDLAAIGFPPSHISVQGLLMTNPGHVDPGYHGPMHLTVINMSRDSIELRVSDTIVTILFFELDGDVTVDYGKRRPGTPPDPEVNRLSKDFLNVSNRAKKIAKDEVKRATLVAGLLAAVVALGAQFVPYYLGGIEEAKRNEAILEERVKVLQDKVKTLEDKQSIANAPTTTTINPGRIPSGAAKTK
jgi:dCTP deaminase